MATQLSYVAQSHQKHDVHWMVVSPAHSGVLCLACLVEQVENDEAPLVQRKVILSLLAGLLGDNEEIAAKFEENLLLCRHMVDIVTGSFFKHEEHMDTAITVCQLILETAESEDLVWYTIDKFHFQLQDTQDLVSVSPYLVLLGRLLAISPAYGFHLLHKHESLLLLVLRLLSQTSDENCLCSVIYIFIHLLDDTLQSDMSLDVRCSIYQVLVSLFNVAQTLDLRVNLLALLKNILKHTDEDSVKLLMAPNPDNKYLVMGLKKMLITKQEVLQTASAHCVKALMSCSRDESTVTQVLESDLAEFLFESLHTQSGPQLDSVYQCLQMLTDYEQFFTRCHAVYGVESILHSLCVVMAVKNYGLIEKGFCLLANILHRQPPGIPLFVNAASVRQCVHLVRQGLTLPHPAVFLQALTGAGPLVSKQYLPWMYRCEAVEDLLKVACCQMTNLHASLCHGGQRLRGQGAEQQYPLAAFTDLLTVCCRVCADSVLKSSSEMEEKQWMNVEGALSLLLSAAERHLAPYIQTVFESQDCPPALKTVLTCMNELYSQSGSDMSKMSLTFTQTGVIIQAHVVKYRATEDVCESIDKFLENVYRDLLEKITPLNPAPPSWLVSGVTMVKFQSGDPCNMLHAMEQSEDTGWTVLVMLYFSYLYSNSWVESCDLQALLQCFLINNRDLSGLPPLVVRCLAFLVACSSGDAVMDHSQSFQYHRGLGNLTDILESCPLHVWYTHHPVVICWVFSEESRAVQLGNTLLEYWLPLIDVTSLERTLATTRAQCSHTGSQNTLQDQQRIGPQCENTDRLHVDEAQCHVDSERCHADTQLYDGNTERHHEGTIFQQTDTAGKQRTDTEREITDTEKVTIEMEHPDTDAQLVVELAHNPAFITTLMTVLVAQQETADIAANVAEHLAGMLCDEVREKAVTSTASTVSMVLDTCASLFQDLFLQNSVPEDYQVINLLKIMTVLMRGSNCNTYEAFSVKSVYHVVKFVGSHKDDTQSESVKWCVEYLLKYTENRIAADCLCVSPILVQNKGFMMKLERILSCGCQSEVDSVMRLVAWLASSAAPGSEVPHQIHVSHSFLMDAVTTGNPATPTGSLCLLSAALSAHPSTQGPVVFSRDRIIQDTPLFTVSDVRTLYFHLQQQACQDCPVVFNSALECICKLYRYAAKVHKALAIHLSSQPWNKLWLETVLHASMDHVGLSQQVLQVIHMLSDFPTCQKLIAFSGETLLHTLLKSALHEEETERVTHILSKCLLELKKTVTPDLLRQVENHLGHPVK